MALELAEVKDSGGGVHGRTTRPPRELPLHVEPRSQRGTGQGPLPGREVAGDPPGQDGSLGAPGTSQEGPGGSLPCLLLGRAGL